MGRNSSVGAGGYSLGLRAGVVIHEGTHGIDDRLRPNNPMTEPHAYRNESYTYQGLNFPFTSLWYPGITAAQRNAAIDEGAKASEADTQ